LALERDWLPTNIPQSADVVRYWLQPLPLKPPLT
jgi:hypothetical protein